VAKTVCVIIDSVQVGGFYFKISMGLAFSGHTVAVMTSHFAAARSAVSILQRVSRRGSLISVLNAAARLTFKPHSARTDAVFSQLSTAVVRHRTNDGVVYAIRAWFKYDTALLQ